MEVFVKHEQAPTAPKLEGGWFVVDFRYIFYENRYFWLIWQLPVGLLTEMAKRHIYGPRPFIWAYNQVCMTLQAQVLKNRYLAIFANKGVRLFDIRGCRHNKRGITVGITYKKKNL